LKKHSRALLRKRNRPTIVFLQEVKMALLKSINVPLGTKAIDFCLKGIDGGMHSLAATELKTS